MPRFSELTTLPLPVAMKAAASVAAAVVVVGAVGCVAVVARSKNKKSSSSSRRRNGATGRGAGGEASGNGPIGSGGKGHTDLCSSSTPRKTAAQRRLEAFAAATADDDTVHFFTFPVLHGVAPSISPFGVRVEAFLRMRGIRYEKNETMNPGASPNGLVPFICHRGSIIADSQLIMEYLESAFAPREANTTTGAQNHQHQQQQKQHTTAESEEGKGSGVGEEDAWVWSAVLSMCNYRLFPAFIRTFFYGDAQRRLFPYMASSVGPVIDVAVGGGGGGEKAGPRSRPSLRDRCVHAVIQRAASALMRVVWGAQFRDSGFLLVSAEDFDAAFRDDLAALDALLAARGTTFVAGNTFSTADAALYGALLPMVNLLRAEERRVRGAGGCVEEGGDEKGGPLYVNESMRLLKRSTALNAYVAMITQRAFPDMAEMVRSVAATTTA